MSDNHLAMDVDVAITGAKESTTTITVASLNIEKTGQSSTQNKQAIVSTFIDLCWSFNAEVIFLCEVHSARIGDFIGYLNATYGNTYNVNFLEGGQSNAYVVLTSKKISFELSYAQLTTISV